MAKKLWAARDRIAPNDNLVVLHWADSPPERSDDGDYLVGEASVGYMAIIPGGVCQFNSLPLLPGECREVTL